MNNNMKGNFMPFTLKRLPVAMALATLATTSYGLDFNLGELEARLDNTISYGVAWRTEKPGSWQIMPGNGEATGNSASGSSFNYDDGTLNYKKGDIYTNVVKWTSDLELTYGNKGGFFRARAWYDTAIMDEETDFKPLNQQARDAAGKGIELLDAYVWSDFDIGDSPASLRLGRQVVSWGESTFIQGGINSVNPVDASAFRKPGAELKEGLLPVNMVFASVGLNEAVSVEGFYQLKWEKTRTDPCGTFFSSADFIADGCGPVILAGSESELTYLEMRDQEIRQGTPLSARVAPVTERLPDSTPKDSGQYGLAMNWYAESMGDTEFGLYYMNIHSRLPYINGVVTNYAGGTTRLNENGRYDNNYPLYQIEYPEDIKIAGISFARATESGASVSGEVSYRPDMPLQWNAFELLLGGNAAPYSRLYQQRLAEAGGNAADLYGNLAKGYDEFDMWQAQTTYIVFFDRILGSDRLSLVSEVGVSYIPGLPDTDKARYGRSGAYGIGNNDGVWGLNDTTMATDFCSAAVNPLTGGVNSGQNANTSNCTDDGYVTKWSGGIRVRAALDYNNAFAGLNVTPVLSLGYDKGNGPEPGAQFIDDRVSTGIGVNFLYLNQTSVEVAYSNFSGGKYNQMKDRDNISLSAKYSF